MESATTRLDSGTGEGRGVVGPRYAKAADVLEFRRAAKRVPWVCIVALGLAAGVVMIHRINPRSLINYHGLVHTAITYSVLDSGIPPENPMAAGLPLPYYWVYHALLAGVVSVLTISPISAAEIFNVAAIMLMVVVFAALGRRLLGSVHGGLLALGLALFSVNALGPFVLLYRLVNGSIGLWIGAFTRSPAHPMLRAMYPHNDVRWGGGFFEYLEPSSRCLGYLAAMVTVGILCQCLTRITWPRAVALVLGTAVASAMNPIIGTGVAFGLSVALFIVGGRWGPRGTGVPSAVWKPAACLGTGVVMALPTYMQLLNGNSVGLPLETSASILASKGPLIIFLGIVPIVLLGLAQRRGLLQSPQLRILAVAGLVLMGGSWITFVSMGREHCFFNLAMYLLALPAAAACTIPASTEAVSQRRSARRVTIMTRRWALLCITPVACLTIAAFLHRRPVELRLDGIILRDTRDCDRVAAYAWITGNTPSDALIVTDIRDGKQTAFYGTDSELPAMTRRALFIDVPGWCLPPDPRIEERRAIAAVIFDGKPLTPQQARSIQSLGRPLYALCRTQEDDQRLAATPAPRLFRAGDYSIYQVSVTGDAHGQSAGPAPTRDSAAPRLPS